MSPEATVFTDYIPQENLTETGTGAPLSVPSPQTNTPSFAKLEVIVGRHYYNHGL